MLDRRGEQGCHFTKSVEHRRASPVPARSAILSFPPFAMGKSAAPPFLTTLAGLTGHLGGPDRGATLADLHHGSRFATVFSILPRVGQAFQPDVADGVSLRQYGCVSGLSRWLRKQLIASLFRSHIASLFRSQLIAYLFRSSLFHFPVREWNRRRRNQRLIHFFAHEYCEWGRRSGTLP